MWAKTSFFYHIYPLGFCGAPLANDFVSAPGFRLNKVYDWLSHLHRLGINALYLGPVFESSTHGYDIQDYALIDRRLGDNVNFKQLVKDLHYNGIKVVIDAVFNHVGRDFFAFRDVCQHRQSSKYCSWFKLDFSHNNHFNDGFCYEGWDGCDNLVKLNLSNPEVRKYLLSVAEGWIDEFDIDGLRLDVAHYLPVKFLRELKQVCSLRKNDFWLMGEVVLGNYSRLVNSSMLDSCTNYELYHALHTSFNNKNLIKLAQTLERQFGKNGIYSKHCLYNFLDNHDVNRIASQIKNEQQLKVLYALMFTLPGIPSLYYGSEWGAKGRISISDSDVRTCFSSPQNNDLSRYISSLAEIRAKSPALLGGEFRLLDVKKEIIVFERVCRFQRIVIAANICSEEQKIIVDNNEINLFPYSIELI